MITCRYCPLYCPSTATPIKGHCAGENPPRSIDLRILSPYDGCPYSGNESEISKISRARGFSGRSLSGVEYYGETSGGFRTPHYQDLNALGEYIRRSGAHYSVYVVYLDNEGRMISRSLIT